MEFIFDIMPSVTIVTALALIVWTIWVVTSLVNAALTAASGIMTRGEAEMKRAHSYARWVRLQIEMFEGGAGDYGDTGGYDRY